MKKIISLLLILSLVFTLTACKKSTPLDDESVVLDDYSNAPETQPGGTASSVEKETEDGTPDTQQNDEQIHLPNQQVPENQQPPQEEQTLTVPPGEIAILDDNVTEETKTETSNTLAVHEDLSFPKCSMKSAFQRASLIVLCEYVEPVQGIRISSPYNGTYNFTDYKMKVTEVFRGELDTEEIIVRQFGGEAGETVMTVSGVFDLRRGNSYVLFLYKPDIYSPYYVKDGAYRLVNEGYGGFVGYGEGELLYLNPGRATIEETEDYESLELFTDLVFTANGLREKMGTLSEDLQYDPDYEKKQVLSKNENVENRQPSTVIATNDNVTWVN